jgi:uncharacterized protein (DUF2147 family)
MKNNLLILLLTIGFYGGTDAQITGMWKTVDDTDGIEKSVVEIFEKDGKLHGRVDRLLAGADKTHCEKCSGELKNKPITGMVILSNLTKSSSGGTDGKILDPASGKTYSCYIELENPDKLKLRGYIGMAAFGRTQYWYRLKS